MSSISAESMSNFLQSLNSASEELNGYGTFVTGTIAVRIDGVVVVASYEAHKWNVGWGGSLGTDGLDDQRTVIASIHRLDAPDVRSHMRDHGFETKNVPVATLRIDHDMIDHDPLDHVHAEGKQ